MGAGTAPPDPGWASRPPRGAVTGPLAVATGLIRLAHPFPSLLDAAVTGVLVLVASGTPDAALRLACAMLALQAAIGTANDLVDERTDRQVKPAKPLAAGLVTRGAAYAWLVVLVVIGLFLAAASSPTLLVLAAIGLGIGLVYDVRLKGTLWSWTAFGVGIPLLPVFAWLGATGELPVAFAVLYPMGVIAGAALAVANQLADLERDQRSGVRTIATHIGQRRTWRLASSLLAVVLVVAATSLVVLGGQGGGLVIAAAASAIVFAGIVVGHGADPRGRERAWELEAAGVGLIAVGWLSALVGTFSR